MFGGQVTFLAVIHVYVLYFKEKAMETNLAETIESQEDVIFLDLLEVDVASSEMLCNSLGCG